VVGKAGLKAGLIGTAIMLVITFLNQFVVLPMSQGSQVIVFAVCGLNLVIYAGIGVLAGLFLAPPRTAGKGAQAGAIAGLISGVISVVVGIAIMGIRMASGGDIPGVTPEQMQQMAESGMNAGTIMLISGTFGAVCGMSIGAGTAAGGGAVFSALKPD
jgi:hypothetical protein